MITSDAPCVKCSLHGKNIQLTGKKDKANDGGWWYQVSPNQFCINCGEPWLWLHIPKPEDLILDLSNITTKTK